MSLIKTPVKHKTPNIQSSEILKQIINSKYPKDPLEILGERNFGQPRTVPEDEIGTPIQEFFRDANVFVTGGTGFIGKVLIEKLLRSMPHIKQIYILIRPKRGKDMIERMDSIFEDRLFLRLKQEVPNFMTKVTPIAGDIALPNIGLSNEDRDLLIDQINIVFHGAATVRFDEKIKVAIAVNVLSVQTLLNIAREMKQLKSFIHVSTAFSHCPKKNINEEFYDVPYDYKNMVNLINNMDEKCSEKAKSSILHAWPNTYTFTKAMAEVVIQKEGYGLPISIVRPAVIISTYQEPVRGWIDNVYGPIGLIVGTGTGVVHTYYIDIDLYTDMIPVDLVVNSMIAIAWKTGLRKSTIDTVNIYNFVGSTQNPIQWRKYRKFIETGSSWPTIRAIWYYSYWPTTNRYLFNILHLFLHIIPGLLLDGISIMCGKKPVLSKIYSNVYKVCHTLEYFAFGKWIWSNKNVQNLWNELSLQDKEMFFFDMGQMSWEKHAESLCLGLRVYLLKDDIHTLPAARRKWNILYAAHKTLITVTFIGLLYILCYIFYNICYHILEFFNN